jgi:hypothetical protein
VRGTARHEITGHVSSDCLGDIRLEVFEMRFGITGSRRVLLIEDIDAGNSIKWTGPSAEDPRRICTGDCQAPTYGSWNRAYWSRAS